MEVIIKEKDKKIEELLKVAKEKNIFINYIEHSENCISAKFVSALYEINKTYAVGHTMEELIENLKKSEAR